MKYRQRRAFATVVISVAAACGALLVPSAATADAVTDSPVVLTEMNARSAGLHNADGEAFSVVAESSDVGERIVTAQTDAGGPATLIYQNVPLENALFPEDTLPEGEITLSPSTELPPESVDEVLHSVPLSENSADWVPAATIAMTRSTATVAWHLAVGDFDVLADGKLLGTSSNGVFTIENLQNGAGFALELQGDVQTQTGDTVPSSKTLSVRTYPANENAVKEIVVSPQTYQQYSTAYTQRTYIPDALVDGSACNFGSTAYQFRGDNRGPSYPTAAEPNGPIDYRTLMFANVNWDSPAPYDIITRKNVGESATLLNGEVIHESYASMDNMLFQSPQSSSSYASVIFNHSAANPHCEFVFVNYGGAILYHVVVGYYRSGTVDVTGYRRAAPAYEGYARFNTPTGSEVWSQMFTMPNAGFVCLSGLCGTEPMSFSRSY